MGAAKRNGIPGGLEQDILQLKVVLGIYRQNANAKIAFPNPDDLYCINSLPYGARLASTAPRRAFKTAAL
jgi:hypothetical protein